MKSEINPNFIVLIDTDETKIEENTNKKIYDPWKKLYRREWRISQLD